MSRERALSLYRDGVVAFRAGDRARSLECNEQSLTLAHEVRSRDVEALALVGLSRIALRDGDYARVTELSSEALRLVEGLREEDRVMPLHLLAAGNRLSGDYHRARQLYTESLEINRSLGDTRMEGIELHNLGHVYLHMERLDLAESAFAARLQLGVSDEPYDVAMTALNEAALAFAHAQADTARTKLELAQSTLASAGVKLDPDDAFEVDWLNERLKPAG